MKRIINGKKYDTETAVYICGYEYGTCNDFSHIKESLYRKKNGEFFLYGCGGPMTRYKVYSGTNSFGGSEKIEPFTESEAKEFIEEYGDVETYEKLFSEVEE